MKCVAHRVSLVMVNNFVHNKNYILLNTLNTTINFFVTLHGCGVLTCMVVYCLYESSI